MNGIKDNINPQETIRFPYSELVKIGKIIIKSDI